jgi:hypothetical protein
MAKKPKRFIVYAEAVYIVHTFTSAEAEQSVEDALRELPSLKSVSVKANEDK